MSVEICQEGRVRVITLARPGARKAVNPTTARALFAAFPQGCMRADLVSAGLSGAEMAAALRREWRSAAIFDAEGRAGAARFAGARGRGGDFDVI